MKKIIVSLIVVLALLFVSIYYVLIVGVPSEEQQIWRKPPEWSPGDKWIYSYKTSQPTIESEGTMEIEVLTHKKLTDTYLFSLELNYKQYLKDGKVNDTLIKAFENSEQSLSRDAEISKIDEKNWKIKDGLKRYRIEDTDTWLNIYTDTPLERKYRFSSLFEDDFEDGDANGWSIVDYGTVSVESGELDETGSYLMQIEVLDDGTNANDYGDVLLQLNDSIGWSNYKFEVDTKISEIGGGNSSYGYLEYFFYSQNHTDINNTYKLVLGKYENKSWLYKIVDGIATTLSTVDFDIDEDVLYHLDIRVYNGNIEIRINNQLIINIKDYTFLNGTIGLGTSNAGLENIRSVIDNIVVEGIRVEWKPSPPGKQHLYTLIETFTSSGTYQDELTTGTFSADLTTEFTIIMHTVEKGTKDEVTIFTMVGFTSHMNTYTVLKTTYDGQTTVTKHTIEETSVAFTKGMVTIYFPIIPGKSWDYDFTYLVFVEGAITLEVIAPDPDNSFVQTTPIDGHVPQLQASATWECTAVKDIEVPAGRFKTWEFRRPGSNLPEVGAFLLSYYSPEVGNFVKMYLKISVSFGGGEMYKTTVELELVSYSYSNKPSLNGQGIGDLDEWMMVIVVEVAVVGVLVGYGIGYAISKNKKLPLQSPHQPYYQPPPPPPPRSWK